MPSSTHLIRLPSPNRTCEIVRSLRSTISSSPSSCGGWHRCPPTTRLETRGRPSRPVPPPRVNLFRRVAPRHSPRCYSLLHFSVRRSTTDNLRAHDRVSCNYNKPLMSYQYGAGTRGSSGRHPRTCNNLDSIRQLDLTVQLSIDRRYVRPDFRHDLPHFEFPPRGTKF